MLVSVFAQLNEVHSFTEIDTLNRQIKQGYSCFCSLLSRIDI